MYDDYDGPLNVASGDEREALMQTFVHLDRQLGEMRAKRCDLDEQIEKTADKQREVRGRLGEALGFSSEKNAVQAAYAEVMKR